MVQYVSVCKEVPDECIDGLRLILLYPVAAVWDGVEHDWAPDIGAHPPGHPLHQHAVVLSPNQHGAHHHVFMFVESVAEESAIVIQRRSEGSGLGQAIKVSLQLGLG